MTRFGEISPLCTKSLMCLAIFEGYFSTCQKFEPARANYYGFGQMFIVFKGQILNKKLSIWSH